MNYKAIYTLESGLSTTNMDVIEFFTMNQYFFCLKAKDGTATFLSLDKKMKIFTSKVKDVVKLDNGYMRIVTQNTRYNLYCINKELTKINTI